MWGRGPNVNRGSRPTNTPAITALQDAQENVELAVLSAIEHGQSPDISLAARIASAAILASAHIDEERSRLYLDLLFISLPQTSGRHSRPP